MKPTHFALIAVILLLQVPLIGCGSSAEPSPESAPSVTPAALIVEREVEGTILGTRLQNPFGLANSGTGAVYCVDRGNNRIIKFREDLTPIVDVGGRGSAAGLLDRPGFITVDNELNVWVANEGNQRIDRFNADLLFVDAVEFYDADDPLKFGTPSGVAVNDYGELWAADRQRNQIAVFDNSGAFDRFIADFGYRGGQVDSPEKILLDRSGRFVVCDAGNRRIKMYDEYGNFSGELINDAFRYPMSVIPDGNAFWVLDSRGGTLFYCARNGEVLFATGPDLTGSSRPLQGPSDIVRVGQDKLLISDTGNNRLLLCRIISGR